ncbi:amino acid adenylation domain-containing protein [Flavobacterium resistens]|uniref:Amino acid adenylation domain-containing protein n=1 Tax=Flavobacterium resistens TaxID=443612 RepID=A0ABW9QBV9_9FLAO|nr:non-ribosomal peptide synthetase [Flavobacterium resistens]MRX70530.1 amino acid adenylation domain-containing protein [Flavobacterium resistens]
MIIWAYVPIDPSYPQARIAYIEKDSNCKIVMDVLLMILFDFERFRYTNKNLNHIHQLDNLAYIVMMTVEHSKPKGVMVEHKNFVNPQKIRVGLQFASLTFDASISEIFISLLSGSCLLLNGEKVRKDVKYTIKDSENIVKRIIKIGITDILCVPSYYIFLFNELQKYKDVLKLKNLILGGEQIKLDLITSHKEHFDNIALYNEYGPTECTVWTTVFNINDCSSLIPIGSPISNTQVYILDESLQPLPIGVAGKLYVSGAGVARGYLNKPELTATRMYDTGDLGRWLPDGNIEFLGRNDNQVKIRGYRIELGEIETAISEYSEEIQQVVVEAKEINQDKTLVAYYVSKTEIDKSEIRAYLQNKLPEYMVPGFYVEIESLPLTPNGKIDRKALPSVTGEDIIKKEYVAPRNAIEEKMVEIWQEVLGVQKIGITDNFFELGGHSLIVVQVINQISKQLGQTISFKIFFANPTIKALSKELKQSEYLDIPKAAEDESYPLTSSQSRLWILSQLESGALVYNMPAAVRFTGTVDFDKFEESFRLLIKRHEILRTYFKTNEEGEVQQHVAPTEEGNFKITEKDYSSVENQEEEIANYLQEKNSQSFDLEKAPLIRASLIKLREDEHVFFLSLHHIIGDGWSIELLIAEVVKTYNALMQGKQANLPELNIQYKDYAVWFNSELQQEKYKVSEQYWLEQFTGEIPVLDLPNFKARPLVQTYNGNNVNHKFPIAFLEKLKTFSKEYDVTLFMTLMAGINALLHRYTGQNDIIIGTPIAGREHPDLENQIGLYLNTLAIRTQLKDESNFLDLVAIQKETLLSAYDHQNYPFDALLGKLKLKRDTSRSALFDVLVVLQNQGQLNNLNIEELINLEVSNYEFKNKTSQFDISFTFVEADGLDLTIEYNTDIYDEYLIERMFLHFENLLTESLEQPERLIQDVDYLTDKEKQQLLVDFNDTKVDYPKDKTIIDLFEEQVDKTPDDIAVVFEEVQLTYKELNEKANQLANYLLKFSNLSKGDFIGISIEKSEFLIISLFGILKAGYAYVLIDSSLPAERFNYILNDSKSKLLIDNKFRDETRNVLISESKEKPNIKINLDDIVYLMYTSGSTGNPKGAINIYKGFTNTVKWYAEKINERDRISIVSNLSFDLTQKNYFAPLIVGARIYIDSDFDPISAKSFIKKQQITVINCAPTLFYSLLEENQEDLISLKKVILGGESIKLELIRDFLKKYDVDIFNSYGPSEASDVSVEYQLKKDEIDLIPIGRPIRNTKIFILDKESNQVPIGVIGEICIGGIGLGLGYLGNDKFTKDKFICTSKYGNIYKSGDSGRWLPDGNIEFLGRNDHQVKIRGYRIELGEIETFILKYSKELIQVAVEAKEMNQEKILVAYLVSGSEIDKSDLRSFLQERLPYYMVPSFYVVLEELPLTPNGKIDRKALQSINEEDIIKKEYVAPRNAIEQKMVEIWQEVLGVQKIGITDNFFELGGHSLIVVQVINQIFKQLGQTISFKIFFANPTIKALNKQLKQSEYLRIPKAAEALSYPLTASQSRLWILSQLENGSLVYNMPGAVRLIGAIDINRFEDSFRLLILGHEILRTYFKKNEEELISQYITPIEQVNFRISEIDFSAVENQEEVVANYLQEKNNEPFILEEAPLLRTSLIKLGENEHLLFLTMHHIIGDGWSLELLIAEIIQTYNALTQGKQVNLPESTIQYKDYAVWLNYELQQEKLKSSEDFWLNQFSGELPVLDLPSFKKRPSVQTYNGASLIHEFSKPFLDKLKGFSEKHQSTLFMTLMTGVKVLLHKYSGQDDIVVGTPIAGREHPDLEDQIGLYLNTLAIRTLFKENNSFLDLLNQEKETLLGAYNHQGYPFDALIKKLNLKKDTSRSALFDVIVVLQNQKQLKNLNNEELIGIEVNEYSFLRKTTQFDIRFAFTEKDGLELMIDYNTDIYDVSLIERMFHHFENLMNGLLDETTKDIQEVEFLTEIEKFQVISEFNNTVVSYPNDKTIVTLFEEQVINTPDNIAIVFGNISLTYKELNEKVNQLAHYLRNEYFIEQNDLVGIKLDRSEQMIIAILSVLKSGAAYVPIDTNYPQERIAYIEKDINCKVIVDEDELALFNLQRFRFNSENPNLINSTSDLAYVIYTSGSTGEPKGVMVEHGNVIRLVKPCSYFPLSPKNILLSTGSVSFDATTIEYFGTLLNGSRLILTTQDNLLDLSKLEDVVKTHKVNSLWMTASWFSQVVESNIKIFENIDQLIIGGDVVSPKHTEKVFERYPAIKIVNGYGPTENTTFSTTFEIQNVKYTTIPIGKPIPNSFAYILNKNLQPVVTGVIGQLYVSGAGVARGYLNKAELTAEKFISNPFVQGERLYDTGDLCKWLPDGNIEFLGRKDQQVKIRGFRIELVEIENVILQYSANFNQVLVVVKEMHQEKVLVAYLVASNDFDKNELRHFLQNKLPDYMIPSFYIVLDKLPLTSNGKINYKALPNISDNDIIRKEFLGPSNEIEEQLAEIWKEVLGVGKIGITDNFFDLGGDSIRSIRLLSRINNFLGLNYKLSDIYAFPSIKELLSIKLERQTSTISPLIKIQVEASFENLSKELDSEKIIAIFPMSDIEQGMLYSSFLNTNLGVYHDQFLIPIPIQDFDESIFIKALELLVEKHEIKKTEDFIDNNHITHFHAVPIILEKITPKKYPFLKRIISGGDICSLALANQTEKPFDISIPGLWRMKIYKLGEQQWHLLFQFHHAILDGWSLASLIDEGLQPVSIGLKGKLYISGDGVARGYLNKPELTAEKFISNPFIKGTRMYDTGDLGRWLPDGNIEFLGRNDHQVKIRGYRIELGEIETAISGYSEEIQQIVVEAKEINQDKTLVAYYVSKTEIDKSEVRTYLQNKLPEYMVPGFYVEIESLPLKQVNHFVNKALPCVTISYIIKKEYVAPNNQGENPFFDTFFNYID